MRTKCARAGRLSIRERTEGRVHGVELGGRDLYGAAVEVALAEYRQSIDDRAIPAIEGAIQAPMALVEAYLDAARRESDGRTLDWLVVHRPERTVARRGRQRKHDIIVRLNVAGMQADNTLVSENWILIDQETGLHVGWYFWLRVLDEVNRSSRYGNPFGLLVLAPEQPAAPRRVVEDACSRVADTVRSTDLAGRLDEGGVGVILFEQDAAGAEAAAQRILEGLAHRSPAVIWCSNLYCYPRDGFAISNLLTQGRANIERQQTA